METVLKFVIWSSDSTCGQCTKESEAGTQQGEVTQVSTNRGTNKWNVVCTYRGILFSIKKWRNSGMCYNMNKSWGHYAAWNKPVIKRQTVEFLCYAVTRTAKLTDREGIKVRGGWEDEEMGTECFMGVEFEFHKTKRVPTTDGAMAAWKECTESHRGRTRSDGFLQVPQRDLFLSWSRTFNREEVYDKLYVIYI